RILGTLHLDSSSRRGESRRHFRKVFHGWTKHRDSSERGGLKDVVSAARNQRAANESAVSQAVQRSELTDAVEQDDSHIIGYGKFSGRHAILRRSGDGQLCTANKFAVRIINELGGRIKALRLARRQYQERLAMFPLQCSESDQR